MSPHYYGIRIAEACKLAGLPRWSPNQLRHAGATRIREQIDLEAAQVFLGHSSAPTTEIYAAKNLKAAAEVGKTSSARRSSPCGQPIACRLGLLTTHPLRCSRLGM